jgi:beta-phosphoglucomutase-like phosphatase (HAD superfamily)
MQKQPKKIDPVGFFGSLITIIIAAYDYIVKPGYIKIEIPVWIALLVLGILLLLFAMYVQHLKNEHIKSSMISKVIASDSGSVQKFIEGNDLLQNSNEIFSCLYTAETILFPLRHSLQRGGKSLKFRILLRRPEFDPLKKNVLEGCLITAKEICQTNSDIKIDIRYYDAFPFLRANLFFTDSMSIGLVGFYRHETTNFMRFVGAEKNSMIILSDKTSAEKEVLMSLKSQMELMWANSSSLRAVLFDLDGVLIDSMALHADAWSEAFRLNNISINETNLRHDVYILEGYKSNSLVEDLYLKYFSSKIDDSLKQKIIADKRGIYEGKSPGIRPFSGMKDLLSDLKSKSLPLALVTGSSGDTVQQIISNFFPEIFDVIVTGNDVSAGKPNPEPYLLALEKLDIPPSDLCVVVENAPLGVRSGKTAGAHVVGILQRSPLDAADLTSVGADKVFIDAQGLKQYLVSRTFADAN